MKALKKIKDLMMNVRQTERADEINLYEDIYLLKEFGWKFQYWPPLWGKSSENRMSEIQQLPKINTH